MFASRRIYQWHDSWQSLQLHFLEITLFHMYTSILFYGSGLHICHSLWSLRPLLAFPTFLHPSKTTLLWSFWQAKHNGFFFSNNLNVLISCWVQQLCLIYIFVSSTHYSFWLILHTEKIYLLNKHIDVSYSVWFRKLNNDIIIEDKIEQNIVHL